jgi:hypothetical protein
MDPEWILPGVSEFIRFGRKYYYIRLFIDETQVTAG